MFTRNTPNRFALLGMQFLSDAYGALCTLLTLLIAYDLVFQHGALGLPGWYVPGGVAMLALSVYIHHAATWALEHRAY